jgi:putative polyketide hydroxylase
MKDILSDENETPILVTGMGPAGLVAAITLARHGVRTLVVDRRFGPSTHPRATVISTWAMELLRRWGLSGRVHAGGLDVEWLGLLSNTLSSPGEPFPVGYPTREQSAVVSPEGPACVPQDHLEPVLAEHLRSLPQARVEWGTEVLGVDVWADGSRALLRDVRTGATRLVRARYLVGADGARSVVRNDLGIALHGPDRLVDAITVVFRAPLWPLLGDRRYVIYSVTTPDAPGAFVPAGRPDRWVFGIHWDPDRERLDDWTRDRLVARIRAGAGVPRLDVRVEGVRPFAYAAQLADRFREGSVFLAGDAAHRVSPRGGTGMNTAIRDGFDIGWRLAWVLQGWVAPDLLDGYEGERRPVAAHNVARSADPDGSQREPLGELQVDLGGRIPHVWVGEGRSSLDLLGAGLTLFSGPDAQPPTFAAGAPVTRRAIGGPAARALGVGEQGWLLARPDGVAVASSAQMAGCPAMAA